MSRSSTCSAPRSWCPASCTSCALKVARRSRRSSVIVSTGARWRNLGVPGENEYRNRGVAYCPHCDGPLFKGKDVAVVGGGNSGVEAAIDLAGIVKHRDADRVRASAARRCRAREQAQEPAQCEDHHQRRDQRSDRRWPAGHGAALQGSRHGREPRNRRWPACSCRSAWCPTPTGSRAPSSSRRAAKSKWMRAARLPCAGVFAAGDCTTVPFKQIVVAMGEGSRAALGAFEHMIRTPVIAAAA